MRLRLTVRRHKLPDADLLWAVPDDKAHEPFTIAQLLEQINDIIPLESPHWGLEDYSVEIGSFEALHFQKVKDVLKDEDHVWLASGHLPSLPVLIRLFLCSIRHLTQSELRARHIAGRDQISANGQHLIDGIPFGKSYFPLRRPYRPSINIPPLRNSVAGATADDTLSGLLEEAPSIQDKSGEDSDDAEYIAEQPARKRRKVGSVKSDKSDKSVRFREDQPLAALPSDNESEQEYGIDSDEDLSSSSISDISSDDSSSAASDQAARMRVHAGSPKEPVSSTSQSDSSSSESDSDTSDSSGSSGSSGSSDSDTSSSDGDSDSDSDSEPEEVSSKVPGMLGGKTEATKEGHSNSENPPQNQANAPFRGLERTKARNRRRRLGRVRRRMQQDLGRDVTFEDADGLLEGNIADGEISDTDSTLQEDQNMTTSTHEEHIQEAVTENTDGVSVEHATQEAPDSATTVTQEKAAEIDDTPATKRKRIDVGSFRRLTMGSLGLRAPKSKEEADRLREKLNSNVSMRNKKKHWAQSPAQSQDVEPDDLEGEDAWRSRIELKAFEVVDESVEQLSTPPFPFKQRWDPQQQYYETKSKSKKKCKRKNQNYDEQEEYFDDGYDVGGNEEWQILNYDNEVEEDAAHSQLLQETQDAKTMSAAMPENDDFPPLPSDVTTLPKLATEDIRAGSIIVYKEMEVSELTGWQPTISDYRTAKVLETDDEGVHLELAARDIPQKANQHTDGKKGGKDEPRLFDITEEEDDPSKPWVEVQNITELWLLQPASNEVAEDEGMVDVHSVDENEEGAGEGMKDAQISDTK
ncbi:hypothetical protein MPH_08948 [Macrophomina phaseolina MS6]|uniref:DUF7357 domain-containing protein n=1 Tax=Macrophomina phaseolina (strain MS6) TaxID=1126212 RepID=K2RUL7_MACPH|nr:hypothetical protein MPH_08948 [Macrophomina phaseolina MS6]